MTSSRLSAKQLAEHFKQGARLADLGAAINISAMIRHRRARKSRSDEHCERLNKELRTPIREWEEPVLDRTIETFQRQIAKKKAAATPDKT